MFPVWIAAVIVDPGGRVVLDLEGPPPLDHLLEWSGEKGTHGVSLWVVEQTEPGAIVEVQTGPVRRGALRTKRRETHAVDLGQGMVVHPRYRDATWEIRLRAGRVGAIDPPACDADLVEERFEDGTGWRIAADAASEGELEVGGLVVIRGGEAPTDAVGRTAAGWVRWTGDGPAPVIAVSSVSNPRVTLAVPCLEVTVVATDSR